MVPTTKTCKRLQVAAYCESAGASLGTAPMNRTFAVLCAVLCAAVRAQESAPAAPPPKDAAAPAAAPSSGKAGRLLDELLESVDPYISLRLRLAKVGTEEQLQNGASRVGVRLRRDLGDGLAAFGQVELGLNLVEGNSTLSASESEGELVVNQRNVEALTTRLGWAGFVLGQFGDVRFGKVWGVYYDIAGFTDQFPVFGGAALGAFNAGTDGGAVGTGRADRAVQYRVEVEGFAFGAQRQVSSLDVDGAEGYGFSLRKEVVEHLQIGIAYNHARYSGSVASLIQADGDAEVMAMGASYTTDDLQLAVACAQSKNQEVAFLAPTATPPLDVAWGGNGVEVFGRARLYRELHVLTGLNILNPQDASTLLPHGYGVQDYYLGFDYTFTPKTMAYVMGRMSKATAEDGLAQGDAVVLGMQIDF